MALAISLWVVDVVFSLAAARLMGQKLRLQNGLGISWQFVNNLPWGGTDLPGYLAKKTFVERLYTGLKNGRVSGQYFSIFLQYIRNN
jgi:hypothetical protein